MSWTKKSSIRFPNNDSSLRKLGRATAISVYTDTSAASISTAAGQDSIDCIPIAVPRKKYVTESGEKHNKENIEVKKDQEKAEIESPKDINNILPYVISELIVLKK